MKKESFSKIMTPKVVDKLAEENDWPEDWWEYITAIEEAEQDWSTYDTYPWTWYMEIDIRKREGWSLMTINPIYKNITVANWLTSIGAVFKYQEDQFLIQDTKDATIAILKWT